MTVFQNLVGGLEEIAFKIASSTVTTIVDGTEEAWYVPWLQVNENAGGTPALTLDLYDGTTAYYLGSASFTWNAKAMTAAQSLTFSEGIVVPKGWLLRVKSSDAAGKFDVVGAKTRRVG